MPYDPTGPDLPLSSLTWRRWLQVCGCLALGAWAAFLLFHLIAWPLGWPGPAMGYSDLNRPVEILVSSTLMVLAIFIFNLLGAAMLRIFFHLRQRIRKRRKNS